MAKKSKKGGGKSAPRKKQDDPPASNDQYLPANNTRKKRGSQKKKHVRNQRLSNEEDQKFRASLEADGRYSIIEMEADGNCLFRSLADQLFLDQGSKHADVRSAVCDYIEEHESDFSVFLVLDENEADEDAADFESYVSTMREDGEWGGNLELVAAAKLYRRNITVFSANLSALNICHGAKSSSGPDLLLSYHDNDHYSSVRDISAKPKPLVVANNGVSKNNLLVEGSDNGEGEKEHAKERGNRKGSKTRARNDGNGHDSVEDSKEQTPSATKPDPVASNESEGRSRNSKKGASCPCGSGLKYKKCCFAKEKHEARLQKMKGPDNTSIAAEESEEAFEMYGNFRVLQI